jgi:hypothetical protein
VRRRHDTPHQQQFRDRLSILILLVMAVATVVLVFYALQN